MPRLIWVLAGLTYYFVGFVMRWLNSDVLLIVLKGRAQNFLIGKSHSVVKIWSPIIKFTLKTANLQSQNDWAALWQKQQCGCAPSEDSDQPGHLPSLIRIFTVRMKKAWVLSYHLSTKRRPCPGWSESSLGSQPPCWFCHVAAHVFLLINQLTTQWISIQWITFFLISKP